MKPNDKNVSGEAVIDDATTSVKSTKRIDPILQELYDVKAQLNAEADYSVAKIVKRARESAAMHRGQ